MHVSECDVPTSSVLDRALVGNADYHDSYSVRLSHVELGIVRNRFGKYYLRTIVPFHRRGLQRLLSNAVVANRL